MDGFLRSVLSAQVEAVDEYFRNHPDHDYYTFWPDETYELGFTFDLFKEKFEATHDNSKYELLNHQQKGMPAVTVAKMNG
jgi:hypothetical protein